MTAETGSDSATQRRSAEVEVEIAAPVDAVWKALTKADELSRWFPLEARVTPGVGGRMAWSWDDLYQWEQRIEIWEPGAHLRTVYTQSEGPDGLGVPTPDEPPPGAANLVQLAIDFHLEARGEVAVLRVVHSGFGRGASWDREYDGVRRGWRYELLSLQHYLERHPGVARHVAWAKRTADVSVEDAWEILTGAEGVTIEGGLGNLRPGDNYSARTAAGAMFRGVVRTLSPPFEFSGTVENLSDAFLRVSVDNMPSGLVVVLWIATYGLSKTRVDELQAGWDALLTKLFPD